MKKALVKVPLERVERAILLMRGEKVILDADLAELYGVENRALIQAVKRNANRFPKDFVFQLTKVEFDSLRSQILISKIAVERISDCGLRISELRHWSGRTRMESV